MMGHAGVGVGGEGTKKRMFFCSSNLREERQFYELSNGTPH